MVSKGIKNIRQEKGWTQKQLAELSGISNVQIARYENGNAKPNKATLKKLADAFGIRQELILTEDPYESNTLMDQKYNELRELINDKEDRKIIINLIETYCLKFKIKLS